MFHTLHKAMRTRHKIRPYSTAQSTHTQQTHGDTRWVVRVAWTRERRQHGAWRLNKALHREEKRGGEGMLSLSLVRGRALDCPHIGQETLMWLTMIP